VAHASCGVTCTAMIATFLLTGGALGCASDEPIVIAGEWYGRVTDYAGPNCEEPCGVYWAHGFQLRQNGKGRIGGEWLNYAKTTYVTPPMRTPLAGSLVGDSLELVMAYDCEDSVPPYTMVYVGRVDTLTMQISGRLVFMGHVEDSTRAAVTLTRVPDSVVVGLWKRIPLERGLCLPDSKIGLLQRIKQFIFRLVADWSSMLG
jgi:hypothetical protein